MSASSKVAELEYLSESDSSDSFEETLDDSSALSVLIDDVERERFVDGVRFRLDDIENERLMDGVRFRFDGRSDA